MGYTKGGLGFQFPFASLVMDCLGLGNSEDGCWMEGIFYHHLTDENEFVQMVETITRFDDPFEVLALVSVWKG